MARTPQRDSKAAKGKTRGKTAAKKPAAKVAQTAHKAPNSAPPSPAQASTDILQLITPQQRESLEALSANLARAAVTAQGAIAEAALRAADRPPALNIDPFHVGPAMTEVMGTLAAQPDRVMRAQAELFSSYMELWRNTVARLGPGEPVRAVVRRELGLKRRPGEFHRQELGQA